MKVSISDQSQLSSKPLPRGPALDYVLMKLFEIEERLILKTKYSCRTAGKIYDRAKFIFISEVM